MACSTTKKTTIIYAILAMFLLAIDLVLIGRIEHHGNRSLCYANCLVLGTYFWMNAFNLRSVLEGKRFLCRCSHPRPTAFNFFLLFLAMGILFSLVWFTNQTDLLDVLILLFTLGIIFSISDFILREFPPYAIYENGLYFRLWFFAWDEIVAIELSTPHQITVSRPRRLFRPSTIRMDLTEECHTVLREKASEYGLEIQGFDAAHPSSF